SFASPKAANRHYLDLASGVMITRVSLNESLACLTLVRSTTNPHLGGRPMKEPRYHKHRLANHVLHPETLMLGYGYDPLLSEGEVKTAGLADLDIRVSVGGGGSRFLRLHGWSSRTAKWCCYRPCVFALQSPKQRDRRGSPCSLRGSRGMHPLFVRHVCDRNKHSDVY